MSPRQRSPYGEAGDRLWVRETWQAWNCFSHESDEWYPITREFRCGEPWDAWAELHGFPEAIEYRADDQSVGPWTPAIHMTRWASRITLEVAAARSERLQDITEEDAAAEGVEPCMRVSSGYRPCRAAFADLWDSINGKRAPWDSNPLVWVVTFKRIENDTKCQARPIIFSGPMVRAILSGKKTQTRRLVR